MSKAQYVRCIVGYHHRRKIYMAKYFVCDMLSYCCRQCVRFQNNTHPCSCPLERNGAYLPCQAYVVLVYIAVTTKKPKYIAFVSCLGGVVLLIAGNVLVRNLRFALHTAHVTYIYIDLDLSFWHSRGFHGNAPADMCALAHHQSFSDMVLYQAYHV